MAGLGYLSTKGFALGRLFALSHEALHDVCMKLVHERATDLSQHVWAQPRSPQTSPMSADTFLKAMVQCHPDDRQVLLHLSDCC